MCEFYSVGFGLGLGPQGRHFMPAGCLLWRDFLLWFGVSIKAGEDGTVLKRER